MRLSHHTVLDYDPITACLVMFYFCQNVCTNQNPLHMHNNIKIKKKTLQYLIIFNKNKILNKIANNGSQK